MARDLASRTQFHAPEPGRPLLEVHGATVEYAPQGFSRGRAFRAVDDVSFVVDGGRSLGLVGESGCGKTTLGRAILGLAPLTRGSISIATRAPATRTRFATRLARSAQMVFQDPFASLDPRQTILSAVVEPMTVHSLGATNDRITRAQHLLERVGVDAQLGDAYPHQLSGGQRQRVCIARALAVAPQLIICDEPTSALDVSIQAQVVELLRDLQENDGLTYLFITHDLALLPQLVHHVAVMYLGRIVETGPVARVLLKPSHPYTTSLLAASPVLGRRRIQNPRLVVGEATTGAPNAGCAFRPRCWRYAELDEAARARCEHEVPALAAGGLAPDQQVACHHADRDGATRVQAEYPVAAIAGSTSPYPSQPASEPMVGTAHGCHSKEKSQ